MNHPYAQTRFLKSAPSIAQAPADTGHEVAFAGRSNAGKSSALNVITCQRSLARTSKTPGRTQLINFFEVTENSRLVDLPGYGYAKVAQAVKDEWQRNLAGYLESRESLVGLILLMDVRHPLTDYDQQMLEWCNEGELPVHVLLTKADKLNRGPAQASLLKVRKALETLHPGATVQLFSSLKRSGLDDVRRVLDRWLQTPAEPPA